MALSSRGLGQEPQQGAFAESDSAPAETPGAEGLDHRGVDVTFAADGRRVAQAARDLLDRRVDGLLATRLVLRRFAGGEDLRRQQRGGPGAKVFGRYVVPGHAPEIRVQFGRPDRPGPALVVEIAE